MSDSNTSEETVCFFELNNPVTNSFSSDTEVHLDGRIYPQIQKKIKTFPPINVILKQFLDF